MAITKTKFINYIRCPSYCALDKVKKEGLKETLSLEEYKKEENQQLINDLLSLMYDEDGNDLIDISDARLETLLPYYQEIELLAGQLVERTFPGQAKYSKETLNQESFTCVINDVRYLCYVDIFNNRQDGFDIIEVKATTTNKFLKLGKTTRNQFKETHVQSIFIKDTDGIYRLREEIKNYTFDDSLLEKDYLKHKTKLFNKYHEFGRYVYDIAVQRFIIENSLKQNQQSHLIENIKYYLAVLNSDYVFPGKYHLGKPLYEADNKGEEIINFIDLTAVTKSYLDKIKLDQQRIEQYLNYQSMPAFKVGEYCELKKTTKCKFTPICFKSLPTKNSILCYFDNHYGFIDEGGNKHNRYDLINNQVVSMLDIPKSWLVKTKHIIQRSVVENNKPYINRGKIKAGLQELQYPIYYLDFETFPCPLPRYWGEKPYSQSVYQFSLHIEQKPGLCDKNQDHYEYLATDHQDHREELIKRLITYLNLDEGGTVMVYNQAFEKTRLKELGELFPAYKKPLNKIITHLFDLMYLIKTNTAFYQKLGYQESPAKLFNYYHQDLEGSFSIKKVLPLFSDLRYDDLTVNNGMEALVAYNLLDKNNPDEYNRLYNHLVKYCQQDTWAMVDILQGLVRMVK